MNDNDSILNKVTFNNKLLYNKSDENILRIKKKLLLNSINEKKRKELMISQEIGRNIVNNTEKKLKKLKIIRKYDFNLSSRNLRISKTNNNFNIFDKNDGEQSSKPKFKTIKFLKLNITKKSLLYNEDRKIMEQYYLFKLINNFQKQNKLNNLFVNNKNNIQSNKNRFLKMKTIFIAKESSKDSDKIEESFKTLMKLETNKNEDDKKNKPNFFYFNREKENIKNIIINPDLNQKSFKRKTKNKHFFFENNIRIINNNKSNLFHNHILIKNLFK